MILRNKVSDKDKGSEKPEKFQYDSLQIGGVTPTRWGPTNKWLTRPPLRSHTHTKQSWSHYYSSAGDCIYADITTLPFEKKKSAIDPLNLD